MGTTTETGGAWMARAGVDVQLDFFAPVGIVIGAAAVIDGGAFLGIQASVGASYTLGAPAAAKTPVVKPAEDEAGEARAGRDAEDRDEADTRLRAG